MQALWHSGGDLVTNYNFDDFNDDEYNYIYNDYYDDGHNDSYDDEDRP